MNESRKPIAWCRECEHIVYDDAVGEEVKRAGWKCPGDECDAMVTPVSKLSESEVVELGATAWFRELRKEGKHGVSPGGAASKLGCDRSMIDKLVDMGVLEKSVYEHKHIKMVFISLRSIERAKRSKSRTGKWTKPEPEDVE